MDTIFNLSYGSGLAGNLRGRDQLIQKNNKDKKDMDYMNNFLKYFIIGVFFWVVVDYTTAFNPDFQRWIDHMPEIWSFYIGYPLLFSFLIYKKKWDTRKVFYSMIIVAFIIEVILSNNALLYTFPIMLIMIPIAVAIYSFITFTPKWIVEKKIIENKKKLIILVIVWATVSILSFITRSNLGS
jgi:hypothetical protein